LQSSEKFSALIGHSIDGFYSNPYFGDAMSDEGYEKRLRAVVQNRLTDFSESMRKRGAAKTIIEDDKEKNDSQTGRVSRSEFVAEVQKRVRRSRGQELPGTFNPLIIGDLFYAQSKPWEAIVTECIDTLVKDVQKAIIHALKEVIDDKSLEALLEHVLNRKLSRIEQSLRIKTKELLSPQQSGHPITYNHYFTENIQKAREQSSRKFLVKTLKAFFPDYSQDFSSHRFRMEDLIDALGCRREADMELFACCEAVDCMMAYYKVVPSRCS
jgi:hypothetical protein